MARQVLSLYSVVLSLISNCSDCLAAPGTNVDAPTGPREMNKTRTCYKCQQEGHVGLHVLSILSQLNQLLRSLENALKTANLLSDHSFHTNVHT